MSPKTDIQISMIELPSSDFSVPMNLHGLGYVLLELVLASFSTDNPAAGVVQ